MSQTFGNTSNCGEALQILPSFFSKRFKEDTTGEVLLIGQEGVFTYKTD
jgi:hypothetical protein